LSKPNNLPLAGQIGLDWRRNREATDDCQTCLYCFTQAWLQEELAKIFKLSLTIELEFYWRIPMLLDVAGVFWISHFFNHRPADHIAVAALPLLVNIVHIVAVVECQA
jgi:hypothetical protein